MNRLITIGHCSRESTSDRPARIMKTKPLLFIAVVLGVCAFPEVVTFAAEQEGVAVAIIYDTSGSMKESVRDGQGGWSPKFRIANRSLEAVANQLEAYVTNATPSVPRKLQVSLFVFTSNGARQAIKSGPLDATAMRLWARQFSSPDGGTPLGKALEAAGQSLLNSGMSRKHILVITDGMNTVGPAPATIMPGLIESATRNHTSLLFHFVAFDVDGKVFAPLKKLGATVVGASDEKQLNTQLNFILQQKILLEDEEPAKK